MVRAIKQLEVMKIGNYSGKIAFLAAAGLLAAGTLDAGVVTSPTNFTVNVSSSDMNCRVVGTTIQGGDDDLAFSESGWNDVYDTYFSYCGNGGSSYIQSGLENPNFYIGTSMLSAGATISATDYTAWSHDSFSAFSASGTYYVPFYLTNQGAHSDATYYGYLELTYVKDATLTLVGGAIEDSGAAITTADVASAVPEPAACGAALGVAALAAGAARKRRKNGA